MTKKLLISLFLSFIVLTETASAGFFGYDSELECVNKELQKYPNPTSSAERTVRHFCAEKFSEVNRKAEKKLLERIEKECRFKVKLAIKEGYSPSEIIDHIAANLPECWQKLSR